MRTDPKGHRGLTDHAVKAGVELDELASKENLLKRTALDEQTWRDLAWHLDDIIKTATWLRGIVETGRVERVRKDN